MARVKLGGLDDDRTFLEALVSLRRLADDPAVGGLLLEIDRLDRATGASRSCAPWWLDIGRRKPVFASLGQPGTAEYYLATACHQVASSRRAALSSAAWPRR